MGKSVDRFHSNKHGDNSPFVLAAAGLSRAEMELKTRYFYFFGFALVIVNRLADSCASNLSAPFLTSVPWMPIGLFLLLVRYVGVGCDGALCFRQRAVAVLIFALSMVSYMRSGQSYLPSAVLLIFGVGRIDIKRVIKTAATVVLLLVGLLGLLQLFAWLLTGDLPGSVLRSNGRVRLSFFLTHPNVLAAITCMSFIGLSVTWERISIKTTYAGVLAGLLILLITDSKTSVAILFFYLVLRAILENQIFCFGKVIFFLYLAVPLLFFIFAVLVMLQVLPDYLYNFFNSLFTGRPGFWVLQYEQAGGWTFFGQQTLYGNQMIDGYLHMAVTIDSFYAATLLQLGVWSFFVYYFIYVKAGLRAFSHKDYCVVAVLLACSLFGATEIHVIDLAICTPMLLLGEGLFISDTDSKDDAAHRRPGPNGGGLS